MNRRLRPLLSVLTAIATVVMTLEQPLDKRLFDSKYDDVEILGKDTTKLQTNYFTDGVGGHETVISLGFDASADKVPKKSSAGPV